MSNAAQVSRQQEQLVVSGCVVWSVYSLCVGVVGGGGGGGGGGGAQVLHPTAPALPQPTQR